jgi:hypothetical protein
MTRSHFKGIKTSDRILLEKNEYKEMVKILSQLKWNTLFTIAPQM